MKLLSVNEVAKRLGCSEGLVYKKIHRGEIPARMLTGKKLGVLESDLDEFIGALPPVRNTSENIVGFKAG